MIVQLSAEDRVVLDWLLTEISNRLDGAIDFWPTVCLGRFPFDRRAFILKNCDILRSFVVITEQLLANRARADGEALRALLAALRNGCPQLQEAFLALEHFQNLPLDEVRAVTEMVTQTYQSMRQSLRQLGQALGASFTYMQGRTPECEEYFEKILSNLFASSCQHRETPVAVAVPSSSSL